MVVGVYSLKSRPAFCHDSSRSLRSPGVAECGQRSCSGDGNAEDHCPEGTQVWGAPRPAADHCASLLPPGPWLLSHNKQKQFEHLPEEKQRLKYF